MNRPLKLVVACLGCYGAMASSLAIAQDAGAVLRNMEQNQPQMRPVAPAKPAEAPPDPVNEQNIDLLKALDVKTSIYRQEIEEYWQPYLNAAVPGQRISDFKTWLWQKFQQDGYLPYINVSEKKSAMGSTLQISVTQPIVGKVAINNSTGELSKEYQDEILSRFSKKQIAGSPIDIALLEAQINVINQDIPVDIDVELKQTNENQIDILLSIKDRESTKGTYLGGMLQVNNYGLTQYGRAQAVANVRFGGFTQGSVLDLTTQQSTGAHYYRAEYQAPLTGWGARWNAWTSYLDTGNKTENGNSIEGGASLSKVLFYGRDLSTSGSLGLVGRRTINEIGGLTSSDRIDKQVRLNFVTTSDSHRSDRFVSNIGLVFGDLDRSGNAFDYESDNLTYRSQGAYQIALLNAQYAVPLSEDRSVTASVRVRGQLASKNLDSYNKIALGGVNGIRAYSTQDGVGDEGFQASFDLSKQLNQYLYVGAFYDVGTVKLHINPLATDVTNRTTLMGAGLQVGGSYEKVYWNASVAKSFGSYATDFPAASTTPLGSWYLYGQISIAH